MKKVAVCALFLLSATSLFADVSLTDKTSTVRLISRSENVTPLSPADKQAIRDANQAKREAKRARHAHSLTPVAEGVTPLTPAQKQEIRDANAVKRAAKRAKQQRHSSSLRRAADSLHPHSDATGSIALIDAGGLKYFINTDITFSTTSSASAAVSEASYTQAVLASTQMGGTTSSTLNDSYDGYNTLCVNFSNTPGNCQTGNANFAFYNQTGSAPTIDTEYDATQPSCIGRVVLFPTVTVTDPQNNAHTLQVSRKVFVPTNDTFIRWENTITNNSASSFTFLPTIANNLGSDNNTLITGSSSGDNTASTADTWVGSFQNWSGTTSSDPRLAHVLQGPNATMPLSAINFVDNDDNPWWAYSVTLAPGQTVTIMNYGVGAPTKAAANTKAAELASLPANALACMTSQELGQVTNFAAGADLSITKAASVSQAPLGAHFFYTLSVNNAGPGTATNAVVTDILPAGVNYISASGSGWSCSAAGQTVTCTNPSLAVGAAAPITINVVSTTTGPKANSATVSSDTADPTPGNNTSAVVTINAVNQSDVPMLDARALALLAVALGAIAVLLLNRN